MTARRKRGWAAPAVLGGAGLMVGAFAPAGVVEVWGAVSLHDVVPIQSLLIVAAGALAATAAPLGRRVWVRPAALLAWIGVLLPVLRNRLAPEPGLLDSVAESVSDAFGRVALHMTTPAWGLLPLALGLLLLTLAAWRSG